MGLSGFYVRYYQLYDYDLKGVQLYIKVLDLKIGLNEDPFVATSTARLLLSCLHLWMGTTETPRICPGQKDIVIGKKRIENVLVNFNLVDDIHL